MLCGVPQVFVVTLHCARPQLLIRTLCSLCDSINIYARNHSIKQHSTVCKLVHTPTLQDTLSRIGSKHNSRQRFQACTFAVYRDAGQARDDVMVGPDLRKASVNGVNRIAYEYGLYSEERRERQHRSVQPMYTH